MVSWASRLPNQGHAGIGPDKHTWVTVLFLAKYKQTLFADGPATFPNSEAYLFLNICGSHSEGPGI